jgi:hypothetical protein
MRLRAGPAPAAREFVPRLLCALVARLLAGRLPVGRGLRLPLAARLAAGALLEGVGVRRVAGLGRVRFFTGG